MNGKLPEQSNPGEGPALNGADAAVSAMGAAMANRDAVLKSLTDRHEQVFKLLKAQREEALKPMLRAKELLQQSHASVGLTDQSGPGLIQHDSNNASQATSADPHQRLRHTLTNGLMVLLALQGAGGGAADAARDRAVSAIVETLAELVETEVDRRLHC